jgi:cellulose synthase/poly-beta-1,6-N-acetylglucosamine synthase-like glycosyltransferase
MGRAELSQAPNGAITIQSYHDGPWREDPLYRHLLPEDDIALAIRRARLLARRLGCPFEDALRALGEVRDAMIVERLASRYGLGRLAEDEAPAPLDRPLARSLSRGALPLADGRLAVRLSARHLDRLAAQAGDPARASRFVLATPQQFMALALEADRVAVAEQAAGLLAATYPDFSAQLGRSRLAVGAVTTLVLLGVLMLGLAAPSSPAALSAAILASTAFLSLAWLRLAFLGIQPVPPAKRRPQADRDLPVYTVLVALYRERAALDGLVAALAGLDYPRPLLDIKLLVEEDDGITLDALRGLDPPDWIEVVRVPRGLPRTKPRALNLGLALARGAYLVVFDAEDRPDPRQLRDAREHFAAAPANTAVVQAALSIDPAQKGFLPDQFRLEYAGLFAAALPGMAELGLALPLGGSSNHFRTEVLRAIGGWDAYNVTEDAEIGIRLHRLGYQAATIPSRTEEEAPTELAAWLPQRTRWLKGWMVTLMVQCAHPRRLMADLGPVGTVLLLVVLGAPIAGALIEPIGLCLVVAPLVLGAEQSAGMTFGSIAAASLFLTSLVLGHAVAVMIGAVGLRRMGHRPAVATIATLPLYWLLVSVAAWRALYQLVSAPHRWEKTEHRLKRLPQRRDSVS